MSDITARHRNFALELTEGDVGANSMALKFPTFLCEVKLDGERIVAHVNRGVIKMQVRRYYNNKALCGTSWCLQTAST